MSYASGDGIHTVTSGGVTGFSGLAVDLAGLGGLSGTITHEGITATDATDAVNKYRASHPNDDAGLQKFVGGLKKKYGR